MGAVKVWRAVRTSVAVVANVVGLALLCAVLLRFGLIDVHSHRRLSLKLLATLWTTVCLLLSTSAAYYLYTASRLRAEGKSGPALGVQSNARALLYSSAVLCLMPVAMLGVYIAYLWMLPVKGL